MAVTKRRGQPTERDVPLAKFIKTMNNIEKRLTPQKKIIHCPECSWVMPLAPWQEMSWCPCGWRA